MSQVLPGTPYPLGATVYPGGVNFSLYSQYATAVDLVFFDRADDAVPSRTIRLDPAQHRSHHYWHTYVPGIMPGHMYGYRVQGPFKPTEGHRFDSSKLLLDPYALSVTYGANYNRDAGAVFGLDNTAQAMKSVVVAPHSYDWEGDKPLHRPWSETIIYEMHVAGLTRNPNSGVSARLRGTYAGVIEKIPYLQSLGITAVEFMPVQQFDPFAAPRPLPNYWGYQPIVYFAPHRGYCVDPADPLAPVNEFRDMVKALHRAGIEVLLDVVFNHTAEVDEEGPTQSFRGVDNSTYYILPVADRSYYADYSGTGNAVNANHPAVRRLIVECLRYWVQHMHVDGFRFDLASVLTRDVDGAPMARPPVILDIESDPVLSKTKLIAEAWDAAGLYQVGAFPGERWAEWNGRFRDNVRRFWKSDAGMVSPLATALTGSQQLFARPNPQNYRSINFVIAHDGFTLNDLVSYNEKHNLANGENNRDGANDNYSWNSGVEGATNDPAIEQVRLTRMKSMLATLLLAQGTPMLMMGDEVRRTQQGNNNPYGQDNTISWFDWDLLQQHKGMLRFVTMLVALRQQSTLMRLPTYWSDTPDVELTWHGVQVGQPDWGSGSHTLALDVRHHSAGEHFYVVCNAYWDSLDFALPMVSDGTAWYRRLDTALSSPDDIYDEQHAPLVDTPHYHVLARATVLLQAMPRTRNP